MPPNLNFTQNGGGGGRPDLDILSSEDRFAVIASWFLGPRAENKDILVESFSMLADEIERGRKSYYPDDPVSITPEMKSNKHAQASVMYFVTALNQISGQLANNSAPFFSPRYAAHMNSDTTLPATIGYLLGMLYNQNNVAPEGGPLTTLLELTVGKQLCYMLGFVPAVRPFDPGHKHGDHGTHHGRHHGEHHKEHHEKHHEKHHELDHGHDHNGVNHGHGHEHGHDPLGDINILGVDPWGHLTAGGSISNLEAMWVARNLKYYPLSLRCTMEDGKPLAFASSLRIILCNGSVKQFGDCTVWELLNLTVKEVLNLPDRLLSQFGIPPMTLERIMQDYNIQTVGKGWLDNHFGIVRPPQFLLSYVNHYSMTKGAAILGIGSENMKAIDIDLSARMDIDDLRKALKESVRLQQAVFGVVVLAGSTEHGSVDPVTEVVAIRNEFRMEGLSFMIHADAAWGGYFTTLTIRHELVPVFGDHRPPPKPKPNPPCVLRHSTYTNKQLESLRHVDSVTVDPHKSGYIPYPAGAICYRDGRLRYLVTWKSPVLNIGETDTAVGIYGISGSKPGASALAVYLSHAVIGLEMSGYGSLLGTALFTGTKMYMRLATMTFQRQHKHLIVTPFTMLKSEREHPHDQKVIDEEKKEIIKWLGLPNEELEKKKKELAEVGSDLVINAFACNFYINGKPNRNVVESNFLNDILYRRLSIRSLKDDMKKTPLVVYSTTFKQNSYRGALTRFRERLGLYSWDNYDLIALSNTSMSPFPTSNGLLKIIADTFRDLAEKEVKSILTYRYPRWTTYPTIHAFLMQGTDLLHLVHFPVFNIPNHQMQGISTGVIPPDAMEKYRDAFKKNPKKPLCLFTHDRITMDDIMKNKGFLGDIYHGSPFQYGQPHYKPIVEKVQLTDMNCIKMLSLNRFSLRKDYPLKMPFYLYGTLQQQHIDHILFRAPNIQLSGTQVKLEITPPLPPERLEKGLKEGLVAIMEEVHERVMQPIGDGNPPKFFHSGRSFNATIYEDRTSQHGMMGDSGDTEDWNEDEVVQEDELGSLSMIGIQQSVSDVKAPLLHGPLAKARITLGDAVWYDYKNINRDVGPAEEVPKNADIPFPIFQMRTENEWMEAFRHQIETNPVPHWRPLPGGAAGPPPFFDRNPAVDDENVILEQLHENLGILNALNQDEGERRDVPQ